MAYRYAVLGGGRQGIAAAFDLAIHGDAEQVTIADRDRKVAQEAADRVNRLQQSAEVTAHQIDVQNRQELVEFLKPVDSALSAVPFDFNVAITDAAIDAATHMCDLGGHTGVVRQQLSTDGRARSAGVSVIPDCGQVPGMGTSLMAFALELLDEPEGVMLWDGGIPQDPQGPWNYILTFNIGGLTNEYHGMARFLREGELTEVRCFDPAGYERVEFPAPFGELESFVTAGGTSTMPWTYQGKLRYLENRTLRYPGHAAQWQAFRDAGLLELEPIEVEGTRVTPREVLHALLSPKLEPAGTIRDAVLVRVLATGRVESRQAEVEVNLLDFYDEQTGFTAMQRCTGFDGAIVCSMMARQRTAKGAVPREVSVDRRLYVEELEKRGFDIQVERRFVD